MPPLFLSSWPSMFVLPVPPSSPSLRSLAAAVALAVTCAVAPSAAHAIGTLADINVVDRSTGQVLPVYTYQGRHYVAGRPGARYAVRVYNQAGGRVMAVMSVDGVNVVSGDSASWEQNGYVFSPWQRHDVAGWRKSQAQVAAFEFTALPNSYAARTGRPENVGVIGVALFRERAVPVPPVPPVQIPVPSPAPRPYDGAGSSGNTGSAGGWGRDSAARGDARSESAGRSAESAGPASADASPHQAPAAEPAARKSLGGSNDSMVADSAGGNAGSAAGNSSASGARALSRPAPQTDSKLGTGHGARENAWVNYTEFERARSTPDEIITIYYDSRTNLVAQGVIPAPRVAPAPQPFPVQPQIGFVPDPPRM